MKTIKQTKQGISLIVLVITIIVMIILATAIILSLSSNGLINRANEAVDKTDLKQMQTLASTLWADAYLDYRAGKITQIDIIQKVKDGLYKVDKNYTDKYNVKFDSNGVELSMPEWKVLYDGGEEAEDGMLVLGTENLFNATDDYRLTIESNGNEIQIETKLLAFPEGEAYLFAVINGNTVIYPKSLEETGEIIENNPNSVGVAGEYIQQEDGNICVLMLEASSGTPSNYTIIRLERKERYIDEGWDIAYTCTNGVWSEAIPKGREAKGDIVAKFYKTGEKITLPDEIIDTGLFETEQEGYKMVITGTGNMGAVRVDENGSTSYYAWQEGFATGGQVCPIIFTVTEAIIDEGVTNVGAFAFWYATNLRNVTIGDKVTSIGEMAFALCSSLTSITIPNGVTSIDEAAFGDCDNLTSITIPNSMTSIVQYAFWGCNRLTSITIPNSVTSIGDWAFALCDSLQTVNYTGSEAEWNQITIASENENLTNANIVFNYTPNN